MVNNYGSLIYLRSGAEPSARAVKDTRTTLRALVPQTSGSRVQRISQAIPDRKPEPIKLNALYTTKKVGGVTHPQMKYDPINESNPKTPPLGADSIPKHGPFREKSKIYKRGEGGVGGGSYIGTRKTLLQAKGTRKHNHPRTIHVKRSTNAC